MDMLPRFDGSLSPPHHLTVSRDNLIRADMPQRYLMAGGHGFPHHHLHSIGEFQLRTRRERDAGNGNIVARMKMDGGVLRRWQFGDLKKFHDDNSSLSKQHGLSGVLAQMNVIFR